MTQLTQVRGGDALATYEAFAPFYDRYTADHGHDDWMSDVAAILRRRGVPGRRLLDVACGTGKSFVPMLRRGYRVTACDASPAMVERARAKLGRRGEVVVADMRALGAYRGAFADEFSFEADGLVFRWRGEGHPEVEPGELVAAYTEVVDADGETIVSARHVQRHYSVDELRLACAEAGLESVEFWGEVPGRGLVPGAAEDVSQKVLCAAARPHD